jgi:hypothetical protein
VCPLFSFRSALQVVVRWRGETTVLSSPRVCSLLSPVVASCSGLLSQCQCAVVASCSGLLSQCQCVCRQNSVLCEHAACGSVVAESVLPLVCPVVARPCPVGAVVTRSEMFKKCRRTFLLRLGEFYGCFISHLSAGSCGVVARCRMGRG